MIETVSFLSLVLAAVSAVLSVSLMGRVKKVERALEVPVAKKLSPDSKLKHHKKGNLYNSGAKIEEIGEENRNDRNGKNRNDRNGKQNNAKQNAPQAQEKTPAPEFKNEGREKNGRRNRRDGRRRFEASSEIVSNEASDFSDKPAQESAPAIPSTASAEITAPKVSAPAPEAAVTRPPLAPRGQRAEESAPVAPVAASSASEEFAAPAIDHGSIRHGRRNTVRRKVALDDSED